MSTGRLNQAFSRLRQRLRPAGGPSPSDRLLLDRFCQDGDQEAFTQLVERHGPMVLGVCRRVLRDQHLAEDAFQATFLVLARKAASPFWSESVRAWLYEVACRTAAKARLAGLRRHQREQVAAAARPAESQAQVIDEIRHILDEELRRMPQAYRLPILLCCLEDRTVDEAAAELGWSAATLKGRLQRGREMLRGRLQGRGIALSAGVLATILAPGAASAAPMSLVQSTSQAVQAGTLPALAKGVLQAMFWSKLKTVSLVVAALLVGGVAAGSLWRLGGAAAHVPVPDAIAPREKASLPPASRPLLQDGLEVVVRAAKPTFGPGDTPAFELVYTNRTDKPFRLHDVGFELGHWTCINVQTDGPWEMTGPGERSARPAPRTVELGPGQSHRQTHVLAGPFIWKGDQLAKPQPRPDLPAGRYRITAKVRFAAGPAGGNVPFWIGELTTSPVEIDIRAVQPAVRDGLSLYLRYSQEMQWDRPGGRAERVKPAFQTGQLRALDLTLANVDSAPFWLHGLLWPRGYDIRILEAGQPDGYWKPTYLEAAERPNPAADLVRLEPGKVWSGRVSLDAVQYEWIGPQDKPRGPRRQLGPGQYQAQVTLDFRNPPPGSLPGGNRDRVWTGVLTSSRVDFEVTLPAGASGRIAPVQAAFAAGKPLRFEMTVRNDSNRPIALTKTDYHNIYGAVLTITDLATGKPMALACVAKTRVQQIAVAVEPGKELRDAIELNGNFVLDGKLSPEALPPGEYLLAMTLAYDPDPPAAAAVPGRPAAPTPLPTLTLQCRFAVAGR